MTPLRHSSASSAPAMSPERRGFALSVQAKIVSLAFGAVVVTLVCSVIFIVQTRANIQAQVFTDQAALGKTYALVVEEYLNGSRVVLEALAKSPVMRAPLRPAAIRPELKGIPQDMDVERRAQMLATIAGSGRMQTMLVIAPDFDLYAMEPYALQPLFWKTNLGSSPAIKNTFERGETSWSDVLLDIINNVPAVAIQVPIKDDAGAVVGSVGSTLDLGELDIAARAIQPGATGSVMLFDRLGVAIIYPDAARVQGMQPINELPLVQNAVDGRTGSFAYRNPLTGQDEFGTSVELDNGWFAMVTQSQSEALAGLNQTTETLLAVLGVSIIVLLGAGILLSRSIAGGLGSVARAAAGLAAGDLDQEVDVWSRDELGRMAATFRDMIHYHQRMASIADAVAAGDLSAEVQPQSSRDRLGIALHGMIGNLRQLVARLQERTLQAEQLVGEMQVQISERRRVEQQLRVGERAMAASTTSIAISDRLVDGYPIVYVNPAFERLTGYSAADMLSRQLGVLAGPQTNRAEVAEIESALREQRETAVTMLSYRNDGTSFWADLTLAPVRDGVGPASHFVTLITDVSERKQAEKQAEALSRTEKLRALGQMASCIAHDLNHSLMLIASYGALGQQALDQDPPDRDELREMFTVVTQAAMDGGDTVKRLLLLARAPLQGTEPIDLTLLVREVVQLTAPRWRDSAQGEGRPIRVDVETSGHPIVVGSASSLRDVLMNLILNAVDALPTGGTIQVRTTGTLDEACVEISDNGTGMSPEVQSKIFEPFFTTKGDKGTGLGLATVFGVMERHGGQVRVHSALGKGTTFRLSFPITQLSARVEAPARDPSTQAALAQRQLRILAVDDEPALTKAVARLLRPSGHLVTTATSGEEAVDRLQTEAFDVVLSDVGMGAGMSGWDLADRVRLDWPAVHFVLATGWGAGIDPVEAHARGVKSVLAKPYTLDELKLVLTAA
jgi:PAS domain S-box-containing protein